MCIRDRAKKAEREKLEFAKGFLKMGNSVEKVAKVLRLPLEQVQALKADLD